MRGGTSVQAAWTEDEQESGNHGANWNSVLPVEGIVWIEIDTCCISPCVRTGNIDSGREARQEKVRAPGYN